MYNLEKHSIMKRIWKTIMHSVYYQFNNYSIIIMIVNITKRKIWRLIYRAREKEEKVVFRQVKRKIFWHMNKIYIITYILVKKVLCFLTNFLVCDTISTFPFSHRNIYALLLNFAEGKICGNFLCLDLIFSLNTSEEILALSPHCTEMENEVKM